MSISDERLEAAARAVAAAMGFEFHGPSVVDAVDYDPRARQWVDIAKAAIKARPRRKPYPDRTAEP